MITMDMLGKVLRMKMRDNLSISGIAKRTGLARNTIRGWLRAPGEAILIMALKADGLRHKDSRRTARALFLQIAAKGYRGGYSRVTDIIRTWRAQVGVGSKAFVPLVFECGEAFQFDWSEEGMLVGGVFYTVQGSHVTTALLDRLTHHCHIVETGNQSYRFLHSTKQAKARIKTREQTRKANPKDSQTEIEEEAPF